MSGEKGLIKLKMEKNISNMILYKFNKFFFFWDSKWRKKLENYHSKNQSDYI